MKRKSQKDMIIAYLSSGKRITPAIAYEKFGCLRLSERIREIRQEGYYMRKDWKKTRYSQVMEYWI